MVPKVPHPAKAVLVGRGESIKSLAASVGVNAHTMGEVLNGRREPWPRLRRAVAEHLGIDEADAWRSRRESA